MIRFRTRSCPGRTGRRVINIDIENNEQNITIDGELGILLPQLTFVVGFIYLKMIKHGYSVEDIDNTLSLVLQEGMKKGWEVQKAERGLNGKQFVKDIDQP